jgi:hypothetical protein
MSQNLTTSKKLYLSEGGEIINLQDLHPDHFKESVVIYGFSNSGNLVSIFPKGKRFVINLLTIKNFWIESMSSVTAANFKDLKEFLNEPGVIIETNLEQTLKKLIL